MGWAVANLALAAYEFKTTHVMFGQWEHALRNIGWGVDWLVKAHITASDTPTATVFVGRVGGWVGFRLGPGGIVLGCAVTMQLPSWVGCGLACQGTHHCFRHTSGQCVCGTGRRRSAGLLLHSMLCCVARAPSDSICVFIQHAGTARKCSLNLDSATNHNILTPMPVLLPYSLAVTQTTATLVVPSTTPHNAQST